MSRWRSLDSEWLFGARLLLLVDTALWRECGAAVKGNCSVHSSIRDRERERIAEYPRTNAGGSQLQHDAREDSGHGLRGS